MVQHKRFLMVVGLVVGLAAGTASAGKLKYPDAKRIDHTDDYHGTVVADPYRWLEDDVRESKEVADWVAAENRVTGKYIKGLKERGVIREQLEQFWNYEKYSSPFKAGGRYFYFHNSGLQNQSVMYVMDSLESQPRVLLDPNEWSEDGTVALRGYSVSENGRYLAYGRSSAGSDWREWSILDMVSGAELPETLKWSKWTGTSWTRDSRGFFYSHYPAPEEGKEFQEQNKDSKMYYHRVGTDQSADVLVYERPDEPDWGIHGSVSEDGKYLIIVLTKGTDDKYRVLYKDLEEPYGMPIELIHEFENEYSFLGHDGSLFYFKTDVDAPLGKVIGIDINRPDKANWIEIIPEAEWNMAGVGLTGNLFVVKYLKDAVSYVRMFDIKGTHVRDVELPGIGTAGGFGGRRTDTETFFTFSSYNAPPSIYHYDLLTGHSELAAITKAWRSSCTRRSATGSIW